MMLAQHEMRNYFSTLLSIFDEAHVYCSYNPLNEKEKELLQTFSSLELTGQPTHIIRYIKSDLIQSIKNYKSLFSIDMREHNCLEEDNLINCSIKLQTIGLICQNIHIDEYYKPTKRFLEFVSANEILLLTDKPNPYIPKQWQIINDPYEDICHSIDIVDSTFWVNRFRGGSPLVVNNFHQYISSALLIAHDYFKNLANTGIIEGYRWIDYISINTDGGLLLDLGSCPKLIKFLQRKGWKQDVGYVKDLSKSGHILNVKGGINVFNPKD